MRTRVCLFAAVCLAILTTASNAAASLVVSDLFTAGDRFLITDTSTGIQWLSPRYTRGVSVNAVLGGHGSLLTTHGFRYADAATVRSMIVNNFGAPPVGSPGSTAGWTAAQSFFTVFGVNAGFTCSDGPAVVQCPRTQGFAIDGQQPTALGMIQFGANGWMLDNSWAHFTEWANYTDPQLGSWLIRQAAAPTVTLTVDRPSARAGEPLRLAVKVASSAGTPSGSIQFRDLSTTPITDYPVQPLRADGTASRLVLPWNGGVHRFVARFVPAGGFAPTESSPNDVSVALVKGRAFLWGHGYYGQMGNNSTQGFNPVPNNSNGLTDVVAISTGQTVTLALKADGTVWSWGQDFGYGSLGQGPGVLSSLQPRQIATDANGNPFTGVVAIATGNLHALAVKYDGGQYTVWAWGYNSSGELGDGTTQHRFAPVQVKVGGVPMSGIVSIAGGWHHSLALGWDGTVWAWGLGGDGQIGNGSPSSQYSPVAVSNGFEATRIAAGWSHSLAIDTSGRVLAWGNDSYCQLGTGCIGRSLVPIVAQTVPASATSISAGYGHSAALLTDGTVRTWGYGHYGQIGNGAFSHGATAETFQSAPGVPVTNVVQISAFGFVTAALRTDGTIWSAGYNYEGELGDGSTTQQSPYAKAFAVRAVPIVPFAALGGGRELTSAAISGANRAPIANAGAPQTLEATSPAGATFALDGTGSTDPDGDTLLYSWSGFGGSVSGVHATVTLPPPPAGQTISYNIALRVTDPFGAASVANVMVTVTDTTPPVISGVPLPITVSATDGTGAIVTFGPLSSSDLVDGTRPVACDHQSGSAFPVGTTTVKCTAADLHGNGAATTFTVTVQDTTAPAIAISLPRQTFYRQNELVSTAFTCEDASVLTECSGLSSISGSSPVASGGALDTSLLGAFTFTVTARDAYGNTSTRTVPYQVVGTIELLVSDTANERVLAFDLATLQLRGKLVSERAGGLSDAGCVIVRGDHLYVCDPAQFAILRYDAQTGAARPSAGNTGAVFATNVGNLGAFAAPSSLAFGPDGHLYVATNHGNTIERYDGQTGQPRPAVGQPGATFAQTLSGAGVDGASFGPDGHLYVSHFSPASVWRLDGTTGIFLSEIVSGGALTGSRNDYLTFGPDGNLYVSGRGDNATASQGFVRRYAPDGTPLPAPGRSGAVVAELTQIASSSAFGPDGRLYLTTWNYAGQYDLVQIDTQSGVVLAHVQLPPGTIPAAVAFTHDAVVSREPVVTVAGGSFVYDGNPHAASCTAAGPFGEPLAPVSVLYNGSSTAPSNAGVYTVQCSYAGDELYLAGNSSTQLTITPAPATIALLNLTHVYDGNAKSPTVTTTPNGVTVSITFDGTTVAPVNAGSYTVVGSLTDPNYSAADAIATLTIARAIPTLTVIGGTFTFDGNPHGASGRAFNSRGELLGEVIVTYNGDLEAPVNAGAYAVVASFAGDANHEAASATATLTIKKATPVVNWAPSRFVLTAPMNYQHSGHAAVTLNSGKVLLAGGNNAGPFSELFDPATGSYTGTGRMTIERCLGCGSAKLPGGKVIVAGGHFQSQTRDTAEVYDPETGEFTLLASTMSNARLGPSVATLQNEKILFVGGHAGVIHASADIFDPATMTFSPTGNMKMPRLAPVAVLADGRVLTAGGYALDGSYNGAYTRTAEIYNPATGVWTYTGSMAVGRHGHAAVTLRDGRVLITGGIENISRLTTATAELFNPATGTFTSVGDLGTARAGHVVTLLPTGEVLVIGGSDINGVALASVELFDPSTGSFRSGASLQAARSGPGLSVLLDGRVFISGGTGGGGGPLRSAEIYEPGGLPPIVYGTRLGPDQLNATADVPGGFDYTPPAGTRLPVGTHLLRVAFTPHDPANYESSAASASIEVVKATPRAAVNSDSVVYDGQPHQVTSSVLGVDDEDLGPGLVTYNGSSAAPVAAGSYAVVVSFAGNGSYEPATASGTLVIKRRAAIVTADDASKPYGTTLTLSGFTSSGVVAGDAVTVVSLASDGAIATADVAGSPYPIHVSDAVGTGLDNYDITYVDGTLTVTRAVASLEISALSQTYDGTPKTVTVTTTPVGLAVVAITYDGSTSAPTNAGNYTAVATLTHPNYVGTATATLVINKAVPVVTVSGGVFVIDGAPHAAIGSVTGVGGIVIGTPSFLYRRLPSGTAVATPPATAGIYEVTATFAETANYLGASATAMLVINEPPVITALTGPAGPVTPGTQITVTATFTDPATGDAHSCTFVWGDGTSTTTAVPVGVGTCQAVHTYTTQGVYGVTVTVTDDDALSAQARFESAIVSARTGTISGGGSVQSPAGSAVATPALAGTAIVTLAVKFAKGATVPSGVTSFTYAAAHLSFSASTYQWMVVQGGKAWYRGSGMVTLNGQSSPAEFLVAATDGPNSSADYLRLRLWNQAGVIYDNQPGAAQGAAATPLLTSGPASIVIR